MNDADWDISGGSASQDRLPISVIIPLFNDRRHIEQCLRSISDSGEQPEEVILVDNGSTDGSPELAESLALPHLRIIRNGRNLRASGARTVGVLAARYDLVCFVDSDDFLSPGAIGHAYDALQADGLDYSIFNLERVDEDGCGSRLETLAPLEVIDGNHAFEMTLGIWKIFSMGVLKKRLYVSALREFEAHGHADDEVLIRFTMLQADRVGGNKGTYFYRYVPKEYTPERVMGQTMANLAALELAYARRALLSSEDPLREMRNVVTRNLFGLAIRHSRMRLNRTQLNNLCRRYRSLKIGWNLSDFRYRAMHFVLIALTPAVTKNGEFAR